jgi:alpha-glucoside transport system substrate-binding protein
MSWNGIRFRSNSRKGGHEVFRYRPVWIFFPLLVVGLAVFAACGDDDGEEATPAAETPAGTPEGTPEGTPAEAAGSVDVLGIWGADELAGFEAMVAPWEQSTGGNMNFTGTREIDSVLTARVEGGNPPDVALPASLGTFRAMAEAGELAPLSDCIPQEELAASYPQSLIDLGTVNGTLYGAFMKAGNKATIWYDPGAFEEQGYEVPTTYDELIALSDQIVADGGTPWSIAEFANGGSGFPGSDFIQQFVLLESGPDVYDQWVAHEIPYNDPQIKAAWEKYGQIALTEGYVLGGPSAIVSTTFSEGGFPLFEDPPGAYMHYLGSFNEGFIAEQFPDLVAGEDYAFFPFPSITPEFAGGVTGDANILMIFNADPTTCSFVQHVLSADAQSIWVEQGGFTSFNTEVPLEAYPTEPARAAAEQLANPDTVFRFDADDAMPPGVGGSNGAVFQGVLSYIQGGNLDNILTQIDATFP